MAGMDAMVQEALRRSSQMKGYTQESNRAKSQEKPQKTEVEAASENIPQPNSKAKLDGAFDFLLKDKEQSLIVLLAILLIGEEADMSLTFALLYLLL